MTGTLYIALSMDTKVAEHKTDHGAHAQEVEIVRSSSTSGENDKDAPSATDVYEENGVHHKVRINVLTNDVHSY